MRVLNAFLLGLVLFTATPAFPTENPDSGSQEAAPASEQSDARERILHRKHILMLFPLAALGAVVIALVVTRRKRPGRHGDDERS